MKNVEQVDAAGNIYLDKDISLTASKIFEVLSQTFPKIHKDSEGMICGEYKGRKFAIRAKNITYLGHPHPLYKKRIQIAEDLQKFYIRTKEKGRVPILLGIYTSKDCMAFCDFNIEDFVLKKAHNSSAHIYTENLADAITDGYFYKEDYFGNRITAFVPETVSTFLEEKLNVINTKQHVNYDYVMPTEQIETIKCAESEAPYSSIASFRDTVLNYHMGNNKTEMFAEKSSGVNDYIVELNGIENLIIEFFDTTSKKWNGIECYKEMINAKYKNKFQPEWPGFYLEFLFEQYLKNKRLTSHIRYAQDKSKGGIDLDLFFPQLKMYGDLKAHSINSNAVQGNDWNTVLGIINNEDGSNHIYYIIAEHETYKDSEFNYEVTQFWNNAQNKSNTMSYSKRMKNSVELVKAYILDINADNKQHLAVFKQGLNSNGKPREPKIMIEKQNFNKFVITEKGL